MGLTRSRFPLRRHASLDGADAHAVAVEDDEEYGEVWSDVPWPLIGDGVPAPDIVPLEPRVSMARTRPAMGRSRVSR